VVEEGEEEVVEAAHECFWVLGEGGRGVVVV
jgi:hypothetical protein